MLNQDGADMMVTKTPTASYKQNVKKFFKFLKLKRLLSLFLGPALFLMVFAPPLIGEVDHLEQMGVLRLNETVYAPNFVLPDILGKKIALSQYHGKFVMLNFWATW